MILPRRRPGSKVGSGGEEGVFLYKIYYYTLLLLLFFQTRLFVNPPWLPTFRIQLRNTHTKHSQALGGFLHRSRFTKKGGHFCYRICCLGLELLLLVVEFELLEKKYFENNIVRPWIVDSRPLGSFSLFTRVRYESKTLRMIRPVGGSSCSLAQRTRFLYGTTTRTCPKSLARRSPAPAPARAPCRTPGCPSAARTGSSGTSCAS